MASNPAANEPTEQFIRANGIRIHYLEWGTARGFPIVCLHGSTGSAHHWDDVAGDLCRDYRVLCPDQRGHGDSDVPAQGYRVQDFCQDLTDLVDALGLQRFILVGHSLGSRVATWYGGSQPEKLCAIVLVDPSFDMSETVQQDFINGVVSQPEAFDTAEQVIELLKLRPSHMFRSEESLRRLVQRGMRKREDGRLRWKYDRGAVVETLRNSREDIWQYAARITVPTLILRGSASPVATTYSVDRMLSTIRNSRLCVIEKAHHGIQQDNPAGFIATVRPFLQQVLASSSP